MPIPAGLLEEYNASRETTDKSCLCHAPQSTLYFGRDGIVSACCYSRMNQFGRYPESSIQEIWTSARAQAMRDALRQNELPAGCDLCASELYARNFRNLLARQFDENVRPPAPTGMLSRLRALGKPPGALQYPLRMDFELSNKCNLECAMCSGYFSSAIRAHREELPPLPMLYDHAFLDQLIPFLPHLTNAKFLGGEPFLIDLYYEIWERLIQLNPTCKVTITTNGTVFTNKVRRVLEKLNCEIVVSLDSVVRTTYESIRRNATYEQTMANFQAFCDLNRQNGRSLSIAVCPMHSNAAELPGLIPFASERGVRILFNIVVFPAEHSLKSLPAPAQRHLVAAYRQTMPASCEGIERENWKVLEDLCRQIESWAAEQEVSEPQSAESTPMLLRCAELLAAEPASSATAMALRDLVRDGRGNVEEDLVQLGTATRLAGLKAYYSAIWKVGRQLASEGLLPGLHFDGKDEAIFLDYLQASVGEEQARRMCSETRRMVRFMLQYIGTLDGAGLIELTSAHFAIKVVSPA